MATTGGGTSDGTADAIVLGREVPAHSACMDTMTPAGRAHATTANPSARAASARRPSWLTKVNAVPGTVAAMPSAAAS